METITVKQGTGFFTIEQSTDGLMDQAFIQVHNGMIPQLINTLDRMTFRSVIDKNALFDFGIALVSSLAGGIGTEEHKIDGYRRLNAYFNNSANTLCNLLLHVKVVESTLDDQIVQDYLNAVNVVLTYEEMFNDMMIDQTVRAASLQRFDSMMDTDGHTYIRLAALYRSSRDEYPERYQIILNNISRIYIMPKPTYIQQPLTPINHYDEVDNLLDHRLVSNYDTNPLTKVDSNQQATDYPLDLVEIGSRIAAARMDRNALFMDDSRDDDVDNQNHTANRDEEAHILVNIYKFLILDPGKRAEVCANIGIEYPDDVREDDLWQFRLFGPCNPVGYTSYDIVQQRMLTSYYHNNVNESGGQYISNLEATVAEVKRVNGFDHVCGGCGIKIPYLHYGVRVPVRPPAGGWGSDVYHDWDCAYDHTNDALSKFLISTFKKQTETIGIYDRIYRNDQHITSQPDDVAAYELFVQLYRDEGLGESDEESTDEDEDDREDREFTRQLMDDLVRDLSDVMGRAMDDEELVQDYNAQLNQANQPLDNNYNSFSAPLTGMIGVLPIERGIYSNEISNIDLGILQTDECEIEL